MSSHFPDHFSALAEGYARHRPGYPAALFDWLAARAPGRALAWDCATGSGQAALGLAGHFDRVVATDASADQLRRAAAHPRVHYAAAAAEAAPLAGGALDLLTVAQAAHWFDLDRFYAEARRVLRPGGVLALWTYDLLAIDPAVDAVFGRFYRDAVGPWWPPERRHVESGYRELPFPFPELAPPALEMTAEWRLADLLGYLGTWSAVKRCREATGRDPLAGVAGPLGEAWGEPETPRPVRWPLHLRVGVI